MSNPNNLQHDDFIDISSGRQAGTGKYFGDAPKKGKKTGLIITLAAVAVAAALGVTGIVLFSQSKEPEEPKETQPTIPPVFTFTDKTVVSGVDITGKTMEQAKLLLEKNTDRFAAPITFDIDINGKNEQLKESDFSYTYDIDEVLEQAKGDTVSGKPIEGDTRTYTVTAAVKKESIEHQVDRLCEEYNTKPKNAYVTEFHPYADERFEYAEAVSGMTVNAEDLASKITAGFARGSSVSQLTAEVTIREAELSAEALSKKLVKLSTYETTSTNSENGNTNMRLSLEACNGSIIEPGDVWSFNGCTGDTNQESRGYKPASVILEGKITDGVGGGICQSSSTIYNAAIRANMGIEERYNHKWPSSYVPAGFDATIDYPGLDLKLSNPTSIQMFMECRMEGTQLYASIWGAKPDSWDEIHTRNELGESDSKTYTVRAWRVYYKDGSEVDSEELDRSTYDMDYGISMREADDSQATYTDFGSDSGTRTEQVYNDAPVDVYTEEENDD